MYISCKFSLSINFSCEFGMIHAMFTLFLARISKYVTAIILLGWRTKTALCQMWSSKAIIVNTQKLTGPQYHFCIFSHSLYKKWTKLSGDAWRYQTSAEIKGLEYWGKLAWYGGGGSVQNLHVEKLKTQQIIKVIFF